MLLLNSMVTHSSYSLFSCVITLPPYQQKKKNSLHSFIPDASTCSLYSIFKVFLGIRDIFVGYHYKYAVLVKYVQETNKEEFLQEREKKEIEKWSPQNFDFDYSNSVPVTEILFLLLKFCWKESKF